MSPEIRYGGERTPPVHPSRSRALFSGSPLRGCRGSTTVLLSWSPRKRRLAALGSELRAAERKQGGSSALVAFTGSARAGAGGLVRRRCAHLAADGEARMRRTSRRARVVRDARVARPFRRVAQTRVLLRGAGRPLRSRPGVCRPHLGPHTRGRRRVPGLRSRGVCGYWRRPHARARRTLASPLARHPHRT